MLEVVRGAKALSDETRVRTLSLILFKECCVCEVMHALKISQTRASRSLKVLFDAGFLNMREQGSFTLYSIKSGRAGNVRAILISAIAQDFGRTAQAAKDLERLKTAWRLDCQAVIQGNYKKLPVELPQQSCCDSRP
jgi:ArsR family transcriptional regulator, arsenate/arsenite/antimonite-responsive transcriptional repressor